MPEALAARAVVLVEGVSDQLALEALAVRRGRNLEAEGVSIVPMGGATNFAKSLQRFGPQGLDVRLAGLCDAAEEGAFKRGLERAGLGSDLTRAEMERLGFYVCSADLEEELIRSLGAGVQEENGTVLVRGVGMRTAAPTTGGMLNVGNAGTLLRILPGWSAASRVNALELAQVPRPLDAVLAHVGLAR